jgi:hypothetical protein
MEEGLVDSEALREHARSRKSVKLVRKLDGSFGHDDERIGFAVLASFDALGIFVGERPPRIPPKSGGREIRLKHEDDVASAPHGRANVEKIVVALVHDVWPVGCDQRLERWEHGTLRAAPLKV